MGKYLNQDSKGHPLPSTNKASALLADGASKTTPTWQPNLICVVSNGLFDAAGYCFSQEEFNAFNKPSDGRPRVWLTHPQASTLAK
jgi:hypothetical protein